MSGWRDADGRTAIDRRHQQNAANRANFFDTLRNRPLSLIRPLLGALFILVLVFAFLATY